MALVPARCQLSAGEGKAGTWVLLRGLMRDSRHWGDFPRAFGQAFPEARVVLLDFPGNGSLHRERSPTAVEAMVEHARAELRRRRLPPPYRLLAMSLGAMVASAWAYRHPQELHACVLINTSLRPFSPPHWRLRPAVWPQLLRLVTMAPEPRAIEAMILKLTSQQAAAPEALIEDWTAWRAAAPVSRANALRQLVAAARYRAPRQAPAVPLLVLNGARDQLVDPRCSQRLARQWGCRLDIHSEAGHDLPLDDAAWVIERIRDWR